VLKEAKKNGVTPGQKNHTTQTLPKKETLKRLCSSLEGSITKLLTPGISGAAAGRVRWMPWLDDNAHCRGAILPCQL